MSKDVNLFVDYLNKQFKSIQNTIKSLKTDSIFE